MLMALGCQERIVIDVGRRQEEVGKKKWKEEVERRSGKKKWKEEVEIHFTNFASSPLTVATLFASRLYQTLLPTAQ
jgi:hypothetical protein